MRIAGVDCADMKNIQICYQNKIVEYPLFGYYLPYTNSLNSTLKENETSRSENFMQATIKLITAIEKPPENWPTFKPFTYVI